MPRHFVIIMPTEIRKYDVTNYMSPGYRINERKCHSQDFVIFPT